MRSSLHERRWVTLVGPSGVGKSLIARHLATGSDAAWVDARGIPDAAGLCARWLPALAPDLAPGDQPMETLIRTLDETGRLTVIDGASDELTPAVRDLLDFSS